MDTIQIGQIVKTKYNSGVYIGEVIEDRRNFWLVEVKAVVTHPTQGDLHKPNQVEGVAFHERKALANREKMNARKRDTKPYDGEIPNYDESLNKAIINLEIELNQEDTAFNKASLLKLKDLKEHFYKEIID